MEELFTPIKPLYEEEVVVIEDNQKESQTLFEKSETNIFANKTSNGLKEPKDVLSTAYWTSLIHSFIL